MLSKLVHDLYENLRVIGENNVSNPRVRSRSKINAGNLGSYWNYRGLFLACDHEKRAAVAKFNVFTSRIGADALDVGHCALGCENGETSFTCIIGGKSDINIANFGIVYQSVAFIFDG